MTFAAAELVTVLAYPGCHTQEKEIGQLCSPSLPCIRVGATFDKG